MSKFAWLFLCLTVITGILGLNADAPEGQTLALVATGAFACLLVLTLIVGRRFKFDPVLR